MPDAATYHGWTSIGPAGDVCSTGKAHAYRPSPSGLGYCSRCGGPRSASGHAAAEKAATPTDPDPGPNTTRKAPR